MPYHGLDISSKNTLLKSRACVQVVIKLYSDIVKRSPSDEGDPKKNTKFLGISQNPQFLQLKKRWLKLNLVFFIYKISKFHIHSKMAYMIHVVWGPKTLKFCTDSPYSNI